MAAVNNNAAEVVRPATTSVSLLAQELDTPYPANVEDSIQKGPIYLAYRDIVTFWKLKSLALDLIRPFKTDKESDEFYLEHPNRWVLAVMTVGSILQSLLLICAVPVLVLFPGILGVLTIVLGTALVHLIFSPIQGPKTSTSNIASDKDAATKFASERWIFINGCCVAGYGLQQNLNLLAQTFGRPVVGIHNRTFGILGDLIECIMQRALDYYSQETWASYRYIEACCKEPSVTKVVLIAHSQGGIMASQILDRLYINLSSDLIGKIEVYTFGNAALRFNNPIQGQVTSSSRTHSRPDAPPTTLTSTSDVHSPARRTITHIEHYCNREDLVTRWGALYSLGNILSNRFCGKVFVSERTKGHMLNQHYLNRMFPIEEDTTHLASGVVPFIDRHVDIDEKTMLKRKTTADERERRQRQSSLLTEAGIRTASINLDTTGTHPEPASISPQQSHPGTIVAPNGTILQSPIFARSDTIIESPISSRAGTADEFVLGDAQRVTEHDLRDKGIYLVEPAGSHHHHEQQHSSQTTNRTDRLRVRDLSRLWGYMHGGNPDD